MDYLLLIVRLLGPVAGCLRVQKQIFKIHNLYFHTCPMEPLRTARHRNFKFILVPRKVSEMFLGRSGTPCRVSTADGSLMSEWAKSHMARNFQWCYQTVTQV